jgi:hypothetical protein
MSLDSNLSPLYAARRTAANGGTSGGYPNESNSEERFLSRTFLRSRTSASAIFQSSFRCLRLPHIRGDVDLGRFALLHFDLHFERLVVFDDCSD